MFNRYLEDKRRRRPLFTAALLLAGVAQLLAVSGFVIASVLHVPELTPPALIVQLTMSAPLPLPPERPRTAIKTPHKEAVKRRPPASVTQPREVKPLQTVEVKSDPEFSKDGEGKGVPAGDGPLEPLVPQEMPPEPPPPPRPRLVPPFLIKKQQIAGSEPHLPEFVKLQHRGQTVTGAYQVCIDRDGHVSGVTTISGIAGADEQIVAAVRTWVYKEQRIPVCFVQNFEFVID